MARTGQPAVRHVAAVERAVRRARRARRRRRARDERDRTPHGDQREHGLASARDARRGRLVEHVPESGRYRLVAATDRARQRRARRGSTCASSPGRTCRRSSRETGETATLSAPGEHDAITVDFAHSSSVVQSVAQLGRPSVGHATAAGKVLLAFGEVGAARRAVRARSRGTRSRRAPALVAELERVRSHAATREAREEREDDLAAIAAPVLGQPRRARRRSSACRGRQPRSTRTRRCAASRLLLEHAVRPVDGARLAGPCALSRGEARPAGSQTRQAARSLIRFVHFA